ncbi:MAG: TIGR04076 family protein [Candidatus Thorarchaeota archaeon]
MIGNSISTMSDRNCIREESWQILCRVVKQEGSCGAGHKIGDEILFTDEEVKGRICISAMYSMISKVYAMMYNARFPWVEDQCVATHACPDGFNPVMFELIRTEPE